MSVPIFKHRTKIVATVGPACRTPQLLKKMVVAGMSVARLNFSHGSYDEHAETVAMLRSVSEELDYPITLLQDLQGPKIRVGQLPDGSITLSKGERLTLVPVATYSGEPSTVPIDYPNLAEEAHSGTRVLLDDGLLELRVDEPVDNGVICTVVEGGQLKSRKGVNVPELRLTLPSLTEKDERDLEFGLAQGVDLVSLSFVRDAEDIRQLKRLLAERGADLPVIAKIEKPQAIEDLEAITDECDALMVARGDLGVEMRPEKVPMLQKRIIKMCNRKGKPVITATQMLESMTESPVPTRAEASDVANAIIDGTDAIMLSGESAVGKFPVQAVAMMARIATDIEPALGPSDYPPPAQDDTQAISKALNAVGEVMALRCIVTYTLSGYTALLTARERPRSTVLAITPEREIYHRLNLLWGVRPLLLSEKIEAAEEFVSRAEHYVKKLKIAAPGDKIAVVGGVPMSTSGGTNFMKIHTVGSWGTGRSGE